MTNKFMASGALLLKGLFHPKLAILALRERGLRYVVRALVSSSPTQLQHMEEDLEFRATPASAEAVFRSSERFVHSVDGTDAATYLIELKSGEKFRIRKTCCASDLFAIKETFVYQAYATELALAGRTVVDVGANIGDTAVYFAKKGARVFAYEPSAEMCDLVLENAKLNGVEVRVFNVGVGSRRERLPLTRSEIGADGMSRTLFPDVAVDVVQPSHDRTEEVGIVPFAEVVEGFDAIDLLKMDCEGCEFPALLSLSDGGLRKIRHIVLEYHRRPNELVEKLKKNGFVVRQQKSNYLIADLECADVA